MVSGFSEYFAAMHGCEPYAWQTRLADFVLESERWPSVIDMPTGSGKSAVLDVALYTLAAKPSVFPRRVAFVVDRRIVVDQVFERAERIAAKLNEPAADAPPAAREMSDRLKALSGESGKALEAASLRGGKATIDDEWARYPDQPAVIVSTVDMFGSRLLFRGYGASASMRPIHAALAGSDCLVILDEVQISRAFETTLCEARGIQARPRNRLPDRFMVARMSATTGADAPDVFAAAPEDFEDDRLRPILRKRAILRPESATTRDAVHKKIVSIARAVEKEGSLGRLGIIVNRVRGAREIADALRDAFEKKDVRVTCVTGRMRPLDRIKAGERMMSDFPPDRIPVPPSQDDPLRVLVATQSVEVGADVSFDGLIAECAPSDSLRQRFGRLARRGLNTEPAPMWIVGQGRAGDDPVYGKSVDATWKALKERAPKPLEIEQSFFASFGEDARAPFREAPLIMDAHMNVWAQTRPEPPAQPELEFHLHGMGDSPNPEVTVIWRDDVDSATFEFAPPRLSEGLRVPIAAVRQWLRKQSDDEDEVEVADAYMRPDARSARGRGIPDNRVRLIRKSGQREFRKWNDREDRLDPGDVIIVPTWLGGLSEDGVWDKNSSLVVDDLGDAAQQAAGRALTLRLNPRARRWMMKRGEQGAPPAPNPNRSQDDDAEEYAKIREWMEKWIKADIAPSDGGRRFRAANAVIERIAGVMGEMLEGEPKIERVASAGREFYVLRLPTDDVAEPDMDGSDELGSMTGAGTALSAHMDGVGERAAASAERLGMPAAVVSDLRLAGRLHDVGKSEPRAQETLAGGDPVRAAMLREPLAKSVPGAPVGRLPTSHDSLGAAMVAGAPDLLARANDPDLVIHLVASHHGYARPLARLARDDAPREFGYEFDGCELRVDSGVVNTPEFAAQTLERFQRLSRRYGHYGLAWLEAILRLADHRQSEAERHG